jgi:hypothetical protein
MRFCHINWFVRLITLNWARAITFAPIGIFIKDKWFDDPVIRNHESIHWYQQLEVYSIAVTIALITQVVLLFFDTFAWWLILFLVFPFIFYYIWYFIEWVIKRITPPKGDYIDLSMEREAYKYEEDLDYLKKRKHFAWIKYLSNET